MAAPMKQLVSEVFKMISMQNRYLHVRRHCSIWTMRYIPATRVNKSSVLRENKFGNEATNDKSQTTARSPGAQQSQRSFEKYNPGHDVVEGSINSRGSDDNSDSKLKYEKAGPGDKRIGRLMVIVKSRKYRQRTGQVMLEGTRLITDAIEAGVEAHTIFFSSLQLLEKIPVRKTKAVLIKVPFKDIALWSDVSEPQGVIGVFKQPTYENSPHSKVSLVPITLICDNIREPGNLGAILRSAVAAQCEKILLTKGCVDLWEPKVLRSGAGAHFHVPITANIPWKEIPNYLEEDTTVHIADHKYRSENQGDTPKKIPDHLPRQDKQDHGWRQLSDFVELSNRSSPVLESHVYHTIDWKVKSGLVIGGETEGLSLQAQQLCSETSGSRVHIPISEAMDSLNAGVSASVILFEALRQNSTD